MYGEAKQGNENWKHLFRKFFLLTVQAEHIFFLPLKSI